MNNMRGLMNYGNNGLPIEIILLFLIAECFEEYLNYKILQERKDRK